MGASTQSTTQSAAGGPPKRRLKNYLLDPRFQIKYTGMVVAVTVVVASVLGAFAYKYSADQTQMLSMHMAMMGDDMAPEAMALIEEDAAAADMEVLGFIIAGIVFLGLTLAFTGIVVTHKLVGPAYKMRMQLNHVADGKLEIRGRLRKGDELQELFIAFEAMVESLRASQAHEVAALDAALERARVKGADDAALAEIVSVRDRMQATLD